jgi:hypothetical protein
MTGTNARGMRVRELFHQSSGQTLLVRSSFNLDARKKAEKLLKCHGFDNPSAVEVVPQSSV